MTHGCAQAFVVMLLKFRGVGLQKIRGAPAPGGQVPAPWKARHRALHESVDEHVPGSRDEHEHWISDT